MKCEVIVLVDEEAFAKSKVKLGILGIGNIEERVLSLFILLTIFVFLNY